MKLPFYFILSCLFLVGCEDPGSPEEDHSISFEMARIDQAGIPSGIWAGDTIFISITGVLGDSSCFIMDHIEQIRHDDSVDVIVWVDRQANVDCELFQVNFMLENHAIDPPYGNSLTLRLVSGDTAQIVKTVNVVTHDESKQKIVFDSVRDNGRSDIFLADLDGGNLVNLTWRSGGGSYPAFSTDGSVIYYLKSQILFGMDLTGEQVFMRPTSGKILNSGFKVRGEKIIFSSEGSVRVLDLNLDIEKILISEWLTINSLDLALDGTSMIFASNPGNDHFLGKLNLSNSNIDTLLVSNRSISFPTYSSNAGKITYELYYSPQDLFVMNSDGSGNSRLSDSPEQEWLPQFVPDGTTLVYEAGSAIYSTLIDGSVTRRLTSEAVIAANADISSDGTRILHHYSTTDGDDRGIAIMDIDGSNWAPLVIQTGYSRPKIQPW